LERRRAHLVWKWELATERARATLDGHNDGVSACAVTPDGRHVVSASWDQTLKVWELATARALATLQGHTHWVTACAVTPDGQHVVSASDDKALKVWELQSGHFFRRHFRGLQALQRNAANPPRIRPRSAARPTSSGRLG
jgi:WD40 repeat protein